MAGSLTNVTQHFLLTDLAAVRMGGRISPQAKAVVEKALADDKVVVFSKTYCPFCKKAKDVSLVSAVDASVSLALVSVGVA